MNRDYKPTAYPSVSAYLVANNAQQVIDFLRQTFDAKEARRFDKPDGSIMHVEVRIDDSVVMIADSGGAFPAVPMGLHVYVPDVDATYHRALTAGGISVQEPTQKKIPTGAVACRTPQGIRGGSRRRWQESDDGSLRSSRGGDRAARAQCLRRRKDYRCGPLDYRRC